MLTGFQWLCLVSILGIALAGGYLPFRRRTQARAPGEFSLGEAFSVGVFLALSLIIMLPNGAHLFSKDASGVPFPLAGLCASLAFFALIALSHYMRYHLRRQSAGSAAPPIIPVIMTIMIAIPSFLLGAALAVSPTTAALMIFLAIIAHKGSAGFALALEMVRSSLSKQQAYALYLVFACSTPLGILIGAQVHDFIAAPEMVLVKAAILSLAAGVFLFMATLHDLEHAPLIAVCGRIQGFAALLAGFFLTAGVRALMGYAHTGHIHG